MSDRISATWGESFYEFTEDLGQAPGRVGKEVASAVRKTTQDVVRGAKIGSPVDTGNLRASISSEVEGDGRTSSVRAEIGPTANYGGFVELGTSRMGPQPYLGPAFDTATESFAEVLGTIAERSL